MLTIRAELQMMAVLIEEAKKKDSESTRYCQSIMVWITVHINGILQLHNTAIEYIARSPINCSQCSNSQCDYISGCPADFGRHMQPHAGTCA